MARTYSTRDGDVVDRIAYAHYGEQSPAILRAVFDANRAWPHAARYCLPA